VITEVYFPCVQTRLCGNAIHVALQIQLQAVDSRYAGMAATVGPDQEVMFEDRKIALDIPEEGITLSNGWMITPLTHPGVRIKWNVFREWMLNSTALSSCAPYLPSQY